MRSTSEVHKFTTLNSRNNCTALDVLTLPPGFGTPIARQGDPYKDQAIALPPVALHCRLAYARESGSLVCSFLLARHPPRTKNSYARKSAFLYIKNLSVYWPSTCRDWIVRSMRAPSRHVALRAPSSLRCLRQLRSRRSCASARCAHCISCLSRSARS